MKSLSHQDLCAALESVRFLHSDVSAASLPARLSVAVSNLIKSEITAFDGFGSDNNFTGKIWYDPVDSVSDEELQIFAAHTHEHPFFVELLVEKKVEALKISDYLTQQQFHRTGIYNEYYRKVGVHRQMAIALHVSPELLVTCALSRSRQDFDDRERELLMLIAPHLVAAFRNAKAFDKLESDRKYLLFAVSQGLIVLNAEGKIKFANDLAVRLLEKYFGKFETDTLPSDLRRYSEAQSCLTNDEEFFAPPALFRVRLENSELQIRFALDFTVQELTLLLEEKIYKLAQDFLVLGLTERESEVLYWIGQGKTDGEIAALCRMKIRTAQKHAEHIFTKLGVETRTAAIAVALEKLG